MNVEVVACGVVLGGEYEEEEDDDDDKDEEMERVDEEDGTC